MKKTVIITGSTAGIGKATAIAFAKKGYNVVVSGRNQQAGNEIVAEIQQLGAKSLFIPADVAVESDVQQLVAQTVATFGKLDVMVNNAAVAGESALLHEHPTDDFQKMLDINVLGTFWGIKYAVKAMLNNGGGNIVNLASVAGLNGFKYTAQYCASKHAVVGMTKGAALDYAEQGIRINAVAPGAIRTAILQHSIDVGTYSEESIASSHPMNRLGTPEDIANAIIFLASDDCPFMTGSVLSVDGGYNAK